MNDSKYVVKSVAKAASLLQYLESHAGSSGVGLTNIATSVGMSKSSALSLLHTLRSFGLVSETTAGTTYPRYRLGLALIRLGHQAARQTTVADVCLPYLTSLSAATRLTARAAVPDSDGFAVAVARVDAVDAVRLDLKLGQREWPHRSGLGKAMMSALDDDAVSLILDRLGMPPNTANTITNPLAFMSELAACRKRGYALDNEEDAEGIMCVAAPVLENNGALFAAISVTGVKTADLTTNVDRVAAAVREHAQRIGALLQPLV